MRKIRPSEWDTSTLRQLGLGKVVWKQCGFCKGSGTVYYDGATGLGASHSPSGIDPEWLTFDSCDECLGIGFHFYGVTEEDEP